MAKNSFVLFDKISGNVAGVLEKQDAETFMDCRDINAYHVIKAKDKDLDKIFDNRDLGNYIPIYVEDIIVFPNELSMLEEILISRLEIYMHSMPTHINSLLNTLRFEGDEEAIVKVALGQTLAHLVQFNENAGDLEEDLHYRNGLVSILKEFDLKKGFK